MSECVDFFGARVDLSARTFLHLQAGALTRGDVAAFLAQTYQLEGSAGVLTIVSGKLARVQSAADRVVRLLNEKVWANYSLILFWGHHLDGAIFLQPSASQMGSVRWPEVLGDITFKDVSFSYPSRPQYPVLKGVTFDVPAGSVTAGWLL